MKPILVLGLGNLLLSDDAVGLQLLQDLSAQVPDADEIDFIDGGTQGLALLPYLSERSSVLILDAIQLGAEPGTVHVLRDDDVIRLPARHADTSHEGNGLELLSMARLLGERWQQLIIVGVEPAQVRTGIGLTPEVTAGAALALLTARQLLQEMRAICV